MKTHRERVFLRIELIAVALILGATIAGQAGGKVAAWGDNTYGQRLLPNGLDNVKGVAAGWRHSVALKTDGSVVAWGYTNGGTINVPAGLTNITAVAAGNTLSLALKADGKVAGWGWSGTDPHLSGLSNVVAIAVGWHHWLALKSDGRLATYGKSETSYNPAKSPPALSNVVAVAAGVEYSMALKSDGKVVVWGWNEYGQTNVPPGLSNVVSIAAGPSHALALRANGTVVAWGGNWADQATVPTGLSNVVAIAAGTNHSLALKADGRVVAWGSAAGLESGSSPSAVPPGLANVRAIAAGASHSLALVFDGPPEIVTQPRDTSVAYRSNVVLSVVARGAEPLAYRWYFNGQVLSTSDRITSTTLKTLSISKAQFSDSGTYSVIVSNAFGLVQSTGAVLTVVSPPIIVRQPASQTVIAGTNITLTAEATGTPPLGYQWRFKGAPLPGATKTSLSLSNVQSSHSGAYSLLVTNAYGKAESSNAVVTVLESAPYILTQPTNRTALLGGAASFAVEARGSMPLHYQWRFNGMDLPGATAATLTLGPLRADQAGFYSVAVSNAVGQTVSAKAHLAVSQVAVWGGLSAAALTNYPPGLTNIIAVSAGDDYVLALRADGKVLAWGGSPSLEVPEANTQPTNVPPDLAGVTAISAGAAHALAVRSDGRVVAWGNNACGQTNTPAGLSNVVEVAAGLIHSLALTRDGRVVAWGANPTYLGIPRGVEGAAITNVPRGLSNVIAVAAGRWHSLALKSDGTVTTWGHMRSSSTALGFSNVIAIACGRGSDYDVVTDDFNLALCADGSVVSWGAGTRGRQSQPTTMLGVSNAVAIAASKVCLALCTDGRIVRWGAPNPVTDFSNVIAIASGGPASLIPLGIWSGPPPFHVAVLGDGSPHFALQPASQTAVNGATVRLHARAVGVQPLRYQWQLEGAAIPGATEATLVLTNVQGRSAGAYQAVVSNVLGTAISAPAVLAIPFNAALASALNTTNLTWTAISSNAAWFAQNIETHDGEVAAQSGAIPHSQESILQTTLPGPGTLSFWWKVSSEEGYDRLRFHVDVLSSVRQISGETEWQQVTLPIPSGSHAVRWVYSKDATVSVGKDAGWVDQVVFTPAPRILLAAPNVLPDGSISIGASDASIGLLTAEDLTRAEVQASTNLTDWITLTNPCMLVNGLLRINDPDRAGHPQRFYRVIAY